ncbi:MAG: homoserine dehydrogenase [Crocinitomicaceae bacterium]
MSQKTINIGLFGFGCVGFGLYEVLEKTPGLNAKIARICVKDQSKKRAIAAENFTFDKHDLLNDPSINTIVELIDDADEAFAIVKEALSKGKAVVTANKKMIAEHFEELYQLQIEHQVPLLYEAACCASIPIIRNLEEYFDNDLLESIEGIVNGSTNYILTKIVEENLSFEVALKDAQEKGFAETNPILDTGGFDAKYKLLILLAHAFGLVVLPDDLFNAGIDKLSELELNYAREKGLKIKLVAIAKKSSEGEITAFVAPKFIHPSEKLFDVNDVFNAVQTKSSFSDLQFFLGKGAGAFPTASAVLSDISALSYDYRYSYKKKGNSTQLKSTADVYLKIFLRYKLYLKLDLTQEFLSIEETFSNGQNGYTIGIISLESLSKIQDYSLPSVSFVLIEEVDKHDVLLLEERMAGELVG